MFNSELGGEMLNLQAATVQLENFDFEELYLIGVAVKLPELEWVARLELVKVREKRLAIYKNTFVK